MRSEERMRVQTQVLGALSAVERITLGGDALQCTTMRRQLRESLQGIWESGQWKVGAEGWSYKSDLKQTATDALSQLPKDPNVQIASSILQEIHWQLQLLKIMSSEDALVPVGTTSTAPTNRISRYL